MELWTSTCLSTGLTDSLRARLEVSDGLLVFDNYHLKTNVRRDEFYPVIRDEFPDLKLIIGTLGAETGSAKSFDRRAFDEVREYTDLLTMAHPSYEWTGSGKWATQYVRLAEEWQFRWCPTVTPKSILYAMHRNQGMASLFRQHCPYVLPLSLYVVWGWMHDTPMPHMQNTSLRNRDLGAEFGLTARNLTQFCRQCGNVIAGAGLAQGLRAGTAHFAHVYGCRGLILSAESALPECVRPQFARTADLDRKRAISRAALEALRSDSSGPDGQSTSASL